MKVPSGLGYKFKAGLDHIKEFPSLKQKSPMILLTTNFSSSLLIFLV